MKQQINENYYFYRLYSMDFDSALHSIHILKRYQRRDIRNCVIRDVVVSYARPFSGNKGENSTKKHKLIEKIVPKNLMSLHKELIDDRNKLFAHTDFPYYKPKVVNWSTPGRKWFPMSFKSYDYSKLDRRIDEIENLIKSIINNLKVEIEYMEDSF